MVREYIAELLIAYFEDRNYELFRELKSCKYEYEKKRKELAAQLDQIRLLNLEIESANMRCAELGAEITIIGRQKERLEAESDRLMEEVKAFV